MPKVAPKSGHVRSNVWGKETGQEGDSANGDFIIVIRVNSFHITFIQLLNSLITLMIFIAQL